MTRQGWAPARVRELSVLINGHPFDSAQFADEGDIPLVRIRDLLTEPFETFVPTDAVPESVVIRDNDVVIGMDGDFNCVLWKRGPAALNQRLCVLRPAARSDPRFLAYALPGHLRVLNDLTYATTVKHLSSFQVKAIRLLTPPLPEQQAIAGYLDHETAQIDALIGKQERLIQMLRERRAAVVSSVLAGSAFGRWKLRRLVDPSRPMTYGILQAGEPYPGGVPYIGPSDLPGEGAAPDVSTLRRTSPDIAAQYKRSVLAAGDAVVSIGPAYGKIAVVGPSHAGANLTQDTVRVACMQDRLLPEYLVWVIGSGETRTYWDMEIAGATFRRLNLGTLASTPIPLPTVGKQERLVHVLRDRAKKIDVLVAKAEQFIALAKERRSALITAAVTGQIDVRAAS